MAVGPYRCASARVFVCVCVCEAFSCYPSLYLAALRLATLHFAEPCEFLLQRKEDPDTQCGFFRQVVDHTQRTYYVLALPRDAQGRKLKTKRSRNGRIESRAAYYRVVRPAAGFSSDDMSSDSKFLMTAGSKRRQQA